MIKAKLLYLKDKQFFAIVDGARRFLGKPMDVGKKLKKEGYDLLHIIDEDLKRDSDTNFDAYNSLTYLMNVEVECGDKDKLLIKLLTVKVRIVVKLPTKLDLGKYKESKLLVGSIDADFDGNVEHVNDLIIESATNESIEKFSKSNRILVYEKDFDKLNEKSKKKVFGVIE
ncbi:MAG: hypothetical protein Q7S22_02640 [Candidatus Micrarchaeota archaeon]|nr:hypothetical protein [Candidatus Micrarchaeota archaeon]